MYCVFNSTTSYGVDENTGNPLGWPLEKEYGYFCDKRDKGLFFLSGGALNISWVVGSYLIFVLWLGPRFMRDRKPFEFRTLIRLHNLAIILIELYIIARGLPMVGYFTSFFNCKGVVMDTQRADEIANLTELFFLSRLAECFDTLFFVLRKKQSHVSFLHYFHHSYVPMAYYLLSRYEEISPLTMFFPGVNSIVHVFMYTYYLLSTFPNLKKYLWWKKYVTTIQIAQFAIVIIYNVFGYFYFGNVCGKIQLAAFYAATISASIFFVLFSMFYRQAYIAAQHQPRMKVEVKQH